jgi:hypothetical protein
VFTVVLEGGRIGENLRGGRVQDLGLGDDVEKLGNGALKVEKEKGRGQGGAKDDEGIAKNLLEGDHVVFVAEEAHFGKLGQTEKGRHGRGQNEDGIHLDFNLQCFLQVKRTHALK